MHEGRIFPKNFPIKLDNPSPKAKAYIAMDATGRGNNSKAAKAPMPSVSGPRIKHPLSLDLAAALEIEEKSGMRAPDNLRLSKYM
jgi:hypothetical protein